MLLESAVGWNGRVGREGRMRVVGGVTELNVALEGFFWELCKILVQ